MYLFEHSGYFINIFLLRILMTGIENLIMKSKIINKINNGLLL